MMVPLINSVLQSSCSTSCFVLAVATTCILYAVLQKRRSSIHRIPAPSGAQFFWGHEKKVFDNEPGSIFKSWIHELGLTFRIKAAFGAPDILVLSDPIGIAYILQKKIYDYHHSQVVRPRVARLLGKGLGWVEGEIEHKRMRQLVSPSLSADNIKAMAPDIRDAASRVLNDFTDTVLVSKDGCGSQVNILDLTAKATLNVVGRVAFLHDFEGGNSPDAQQILNARRTGVRPIARFAGFLTLMLLRRFPLLNDLPIPAIQAQGMAKVAIQSGVAHEMINRNKDFVGDGVERSHKDLLSVLLLANAENNLSPTELYEQISTFIITGHEATTLTLGFTIWELSRHPDVQRRLREEITTFAGEPTYDDFTLRFPYLDAILKETLRLYPGLPYMERVSTKPDIIPLGQAVSLQDKTQLHGIPVNPGQTILIPIIAIHRLDAVWEDADSFRPDRWLENLPSKEKLCSGWSNILAFSDGPRNCIGAKLAIFQYKVIISGLVSRFVFEDTGAKISLKISSSLQPWVVGETEKGPQLPVVVKLV